MQIRLGDSKDLPKKAELTQSMLQDIKTTHSNVQYIDVNVSSPYIKTDVIPEVKKHQTGTKTTENSSTKKDDTKQDKQGHVEDKR